MIGVIQFAMLWSFVDELVDQYWGRTAVNELKEHLKEQQEEESKAQRERYKKVGLAKPSSSPKKKKTSRDSLSAKLRKMDTMQRLEAMHPYQYSREKKEKEEEDKQEELFQYGSILAPLAPIVHHMMSNQLAYRSSMRALKLNHATPEDLAAERKTIACCPVGSNRRWQAWLHP